MLGLSAQMSSKYGSVATWNSYGANGSSWIEQGLACCAGSVSEALEGHCGFGSAIQVVLRYLGGAASSREMAARMGDSATASASGPAQNGKQGLGANAYAGDLISISRLLRPSQQYQYVQEALDS